MKRDMELIRAIMLWAEGQEHAGFRDNPKIEGYTEEQIGYHVHLLGQAGLATTLEVIECRAKSPYSSIQALTNKGHDFIDATRKTPTWEKAKEIIIEKGPGFTLDLLLKWLEGYLPQPKLH